MATRPYRYFLRYILPEWKLLHAPGPGYPTKEAIRKSMQPGDVMLSKSSYAFTNWIIGGKFSHAAVVTHLPDNLHGGFLIAEMTNKDFDLVTVNEFCEGCTRIALLRLNDLSGLYGRLMSDKALSLSASRYDVEFTLGITSLYCSELAYQSDFERRMQADLSDLVGLDRPYLSPDGIYDAKGLYALYEWQDSGW